MDENKKNLDEVLEEILEEDLENTNNTSEVSENRQMRSKKRKKKEKKKKWKIIKRVFLILMMICIIATIVGGALIYNKYKDELSASVKKGYDVIETMSDKDFNTRQPTYIYDKNGKIIKVFKSYNYIYKKYDEINPYVFDATVAIEDQRFYEHKGIDLKGLARAVYSTIVKHDTQGGSTITQQLAKNIYLSMDRTIWRKVSEAVIAQELESRYSKEEILEFYVNNVNYGNGCYSIETAAKYYFGKSTKDLSVAEIAMIVGIPNNPSLYDPITNFENANNKKDTILYVMHTQGYLTAEEYNEELKREIKLKINSHNLDNSITDYAQSYAVDQAVEALMKYYGFRFMYEFDTDEERTAYKNYYSEQYSIYYSELIGGGYKIYTCIDKELQKELQEIVDSEMYYYTSKGDNGLYEKQAAATVIDNETGLVAAIVGGRTQDDITNSFNRAFLSSRQPGSTIKPLIVYTPAIEKGYNENSKLVDEYIEDGPKNAYSGYYGTLSLRKAVAISTNTTAYKLTQEIGVKNALQYLYNMEFKYLSRKDKESNTIGLGGFTYGVTTVEMASAYSTLARNGEFISPTNVTKIYDTMTDTVIFEHTGKTKRIYDEGASYLMTDVLKSVLTYGTGSNYRLNTASEQAGKSGTTDNAKDVWFCGYTPSYSMAVWVGNDTPEPQSYMTAQGRIWQRMMNNLNSGKSEEFEVPDNVYTENGTLLYTKTKNKKKVNTYFKKIEEERLEKEKENMKNFKYFIEKEDVIHNADILISLYIYKLAYCDINSGEDVLNITQLIENGDKIINEVNDSTLKTEYYDARSIAESKIDEYIEYLNSGVLEEAEAKKEELWNNIFYEFNNKKNNIDIVYPIIEEPEIEDPTIPPVIDEEPTTPTINEEEIQPNMR